MGQALASVPNNTGKEKKEGREGEKELINPSNSENLAS